MFQILHYSFMVRAFEAGIVVAIIAPLLGIFLVLRRYSLMADTLAHVSLAGVAIGLITKIDPVIAAVITSTVGSLVIDRLRVSKKNLRGICFGFISFRQSCFSYSFN